MKNRIALSALFVVMGASLLAGLTGCEETLSGTDVLLPYREELVVQGFLTADGNDDNDTILITRTLPPLEKWDIGKAAVTDATVSISSDGIDYPLTHISKGRYQASGLQPMPGKSYKLSVKWKNLSVTGTATIPVTPEVERLYIDTVEGGCDYFFPDEEQEYKADAVRVLLEYVPHGANMNSARIGISYSVNGEYQYRDEGYNYFFYDIDSSGSTNKAVVNERCYYGEDPYVLTVDTIFLNLVEYEAAFRRYYDTRWNGDDDNIFFGPSGEHPDWNISGDGFGWFFGRSTLIDTTVFK